MHGLVSGIEKRGETCTVFTSRGGASGANYEGKAVAKRASPPYSKDMRGLTRGRAGHLTEVETTRSRLLSRPSLGSTQNGGLMAVMRVTVYAAETPPLVVISSGRRATRTTVSEGGREVRAKGETASVGGTREAVAATIPSQRCMNKEVYTYL